MPKLLLYTITLLLVSCTPRPGAKTGADKYANNLTLFESNPLNPYFEIYHTDNDSSTLYFRILSDEVLYNRQAIDDDYTARLRFSYRMYNAENSKIFLDSGSVITKDVVKEKFSHFVLGQLPIKSVNGKINRILIKLEDLNRNVEVESQLYLNKLNPYNPQYFKLRNSRNEMIFGSYVNRAETLLVENQLGNASRFFIKVFEEDFPYPPPPFSRITNKPVGRFPTTTKVKHPNELRNFNVMIPAKGYIIIQADTSSQLGCAVFNFGEDYPETTTPEGLIRPLRYLCTKKEYEKMMDSEDRKKASDKFWLGISPSKERARALIKEYYDRIHKANAFFSSYVPGWKSDRGMVSIVLGWPTTIKRLRDSEIWIYGDGKQFRATTFKFIQYDNPFSTNDYRLERDDSYKYIWYKAVDSWRAGRIFTLN
ncbi:MAG: GWxTD domain-containing protein [Flavobacteriales bacterium]